jgi:hypothetical protein
LTPRKEPSRARAGASAGVHRRRIEPKKPTSYVLTRAAARCRSTMTGTSSGVTRVYQTSSGYTKTTGPSWWRRVQVLRSTAAGESPRRSTSARNASRRSPPPLAPQRPSPGVAQTKICRSLATSAILCRAGDKSRTARRQLPTTPSPRAPGHAGPSRSPWPSRRLPRRRRARPARRRRSG